VAPKAQGVRLLAVSFEIHTVVQELAPEIARAEARDAVVGVDRIVGEHLANDPRLPA
jgi:hypothetical protein